MNGDLRDALKALARTPVLLVSSDYDGTIAPIVDRPEHAQPLRESVTALRALAQLPNTHVAVVSGRALRDLAALSRLPDEVHLVGSHGSEFDIGFASALGVAAASLRDRITRELQEIAARYPGTQVEPKPTGAALHVRRADPADAERVLDEVRAGPAKRTGVTTREGKSVIELLVVSTHKGDAIDRIRHAVGASAAIFAGDDVTDEDAFRHLTGPDVSIKVGAGPTAAAFRLDAPEDLAKVFAGLHDARRDWLFGQRAVPIQRHSMLSDQRSLALLTPDARICWLCHPRADSAALFAELLGDASAGTFAVKPAHGGLPTAQRYLPGTMRLETRWAGMTVTDYLDCSRGRPSEQAGRSDLIRVLSGEATAAIEFAPRPDFGRAPVTLRASTEGLEVIGAAEPVVLYAPGIEWRIESSGQHETASAEVDLRAGPVVLELRLGSTSLAASRARESDRRRESDTYWSSWLEGLQLPSQAREIVARSALTLRGLCHAPTGAMLAAATTSLPEGIGGVRNWDYRYCWPRDASVAARELVGLGSLTEASALLLFLEGLVASEAGPERLRPVYGLDGNHLGPEAVIDTLPGYAGSRPVRVGNAADHQVQLDVFGPIAELLVAVAMSRRRVGFGEQALIRAMVEAVERRWHEPDNGIWEIRKPPRHHVHSKVMCWQAVDRGIALVELGGDPPPTAWLELRDMIAHDVLTNGYKPDQGTFTAAYDGDDLDAAALSVGLSGLLAPDDPRFLGTVAAVELVLRDGPTVYRYRADDGLPGVEGGFALCTAWLVEAYALCGRLDDAQELFTQLLEQAGPTGLFSEQYDPHGERALGNHPQAYSHLGVIRCARLLDAIAR